VRIYGFTAHNNYYLQGFENIYREGRGWFSALKFPPNLNLLLCRSGSKSSATTRRWGWRISQVRKSRPFDRLRAGSGAPHPRWRKS